MGDQEIPRKEYVRLLPRLMEAVKPAGKRVVDAHLDVGRWIPSRPGSQRIEKAQTSGHSRIGI